MQGHRRRQATKRCTATPFRPKGYGGTGSSTVLALLDNVQTLSVSRRLVFDPAAPVTRPHLLLGQTLSLQFSHCLVARSLRRRPDKACDRGPAQTYQ